MSSDPETSTRPASRHGSSHKLAAKEGSISTIRRRAESSTSSATVSRAANAVKSTPQLRVTLYNLVSTGYLPADTRVIFRDYSAIVTARGTLIPVYNEENWATLFPWLQGEYETPSAWATAMIKGARTGKVAVNGWSAIKVKIQQHSVLTEMFSGQGSPEVSLDVLRKRYLTDLKYHGSAQAETESAMADAGKGKHNDISCKFGQRYVIVFTFSHRLRGNISRQKEKKMALSKSRRRTEDLNQQM